MLLTFFMLKKNLKLEYNFNNKETIEIPYIHQVQVNPLISLLGLIYLSII